MRETGITAEQTDILKVELSERVELSEQRRGEVTQKTGRSTYRSARLSEAFEGLEVSGETPGVNNQFSYPAEPTYPTPRDVEEGDPLAWQQDGLCAQTDPEAFFPEKGGSTRDAKKVCTTCDVKDRCLQYALDNDERFGIWGGLSERERRKLKRNAA